MIDVFAVAEEAPDFVLLSDILVNAHAPYRLRDAVGRAVDKVVGPAVEIRGRHVLQHGLCHTALAADRDLVIGERSVVARVRLLRGIEDFTEVQRHRTVARVSLGSPGREDWAAQCRRKIKVLPVTAKLGWSGDIGGNGSAGMIEQLLEAEQKEGFVVAVIQMRYQQRTAEGNAGV